MKIAKRNLMMFSVFTFLGLVGLILALFKSFTDDFQNGMLDGLASTLIVMGVGGLIFSYRLLKDPAKAKQVELSKTEERAQMIATKTGATSLLISIMIEALGALVCGFGNFSGHKEVSMTFGFLILMQAIAITGFNVYYRRKY